ncbi:NAD(P)-binding protein [Saccharata proteae CBS 121410]|uniref:NAD(P)-binding protein n=1 Tax=Saccharata proteae CBS 121410 TaxID=1314787 RepID=A0A9P4LX18_9PEZI|nr:NAD(P)-binding protein [Saccharata proteae CBS 121410]
MTDVPETTRAIVAFEPSGDPPSPAFRLETLNFAAPAADEVIVRMVASGICHSDVVLACYPGQGDRVLGHEGAGYVVKTGQDVTKVAVDDPVLLSFNFCGSCAPCTASPPIPSRYNNFHPLNIVSLPSTFSSAGKPIGGSFFDQSSFANYSRVKGNSICNAKDLIRSEDELKLFAPLGCGLQTGAGCITNVACAGPDTTVMVMGLGGVGLGAIMAAAIRGCQKIIAVDRIPSRLQLASELGATHAINTSQGTADLDAEVRKIHAAGTDCVIDTTGVDFLLKAGLSSLGNAGQLIFPLLPGWTKGATIKFVTVGDADPREFVPQMIQWYRQGQFPVEKLVKYFPAEEFNKALAEMHSGEAIKPILLW